MKFLRAPFTFDELLASGEESFPGHSEEVQDELIMFGNDARRVKAEYEHLCVLNPKMKPAYVKEYAASKAEILNNANAIAQTVRQM